MLDSLVRVSRRVEENHFDRIMTTLAEAAQKARSTPRSLPRQENGDITTTPRCDLPPPLPNLAISTHPDLHHATRTVQKHNEK